MNIAKVAILGLALLLMAFPFLGVAQAGKGETMQYYEFYLEGHSFRGPETKVWRTADNVVQARGWVYEASYIRVTIGETVYEPDPADYSCTMDFTLDYNTMIFDCRVSEMFVVAGGTISHHTAETVTEYGTEYNGGGSFVGFGSGALEGVKIQGTTGMTPERTLMRVGVVMGWP